MNTARDATSRIRIISSKPPSALPLYMPDYLTDSTNRRNVKVGRRLGYGAGLIPRLLVAAEHDLTWLILQNGRGPLYTHEFGAEARAHVFEVIDEAAAWCAAQRGTAGGRHTNIIMPAASLPPRCKLPRGAHVEPVRDLVGLVRYLSGPPDAGTNYCVKDAKTGLHHPPTEEMRLAALAEYTEAKKRGRLPRMQWTQFLPRLKPDALVGLPDAAD